MVPIYSFEPIYGNVNKLLILGSMPSIKSLENSFYYMHPANRFWPLITKILNAEYPSTIVQKKQLLMQNNIALWDVLKCCEREGSLDSNIKNAEPNDLYRIPGFGSLPVFVNGKTAQKYFLQYFRDYTCTLLPSTSPANRKYFNEEVWLELRKYL